MKILMVHKFHYVEGGAERYVFNLTRLLESRGHTVIPFAMQHPGNEASEYSDYFSPRIDPDQLTSKGATTSRIKTLSRFLYNREAQRRLDQLIRDTQPDIAHVHSIYHHLSPAIFSTLKKHNLPVCLTLHDYKLVCPNYIFLDGRRQVCEACQGKKFWNATLKKCFRDSYAASALVTAEAFLHKWLKSYQNGVDLFISPSRFLGGKVEQYGYGRTRFIIQPYTLDLFAYPPHYDSSSYFIFMGRLTHEKGLHLLFDAVKDLQGAECYVLGTGPIEDELKQRIQREQLTSIRMMGYQSGDALKSLVANSKFTVVPSEWHDNSPLVIYESQALGKPVIGSNRGGIPELIDEGVDGHVFQSGDRDQLREKINHLINHPELIVRMGKAARRKAELQYDPDVHYEHMLKHYETCKFESQKSR